MSKFWDYPEYRMCSSWEATQYAMGTSYGRTYMKEIREKFGLSAEFVVEVTGTRVGDGATKTCTVFVKMDDSYSFRTDAVHHKGKYIINGFKSSTAKRAVVVTYAELQEQVKASEMYLDIQDAAAEIAQEKYISAMIGLYQGMSPAALEGATDKVWELVEAEKFEELRAWFEAHEFTKIPPVEDLTKLTRSMGGWCVKSGPDGWGHQCGTNMEIDWANRTFALRGWSSDD